ncbi:hypothetical protein ACQKJ1_19710 [Methylorubrum rhodesianum]|uniref:hypothetical protein n=1 Tax=Methylorubrum rhodesianum TaxID=29427 RepID=UPI003D04CCB9
MLKNLATELVGHASGLAGRLIPILREGPGDLVRAMNCFCSDPIEGHDSYPIDTGRAPTRDYIRDTTIAPQSAATSHT